MYTLATSIQNCTGGSTHHNFIRKRNNGIQIRKEEVEVSLITVEMIPYIEIPNESSETLLELMRSPNLQNTRPIKKKSILFDFFDYTVAIQNSNMKFSFFHS